MTAYNHGLFEFCKALPKIELHAHLNGSVRLSTLRELALAKGLNDAPIVAAAPANPSLQKVESTPAKPTLTAGLSPYFAFFNLLHEITTTLDVIRRITRECVEDFAADNVRYLEIRTTPKSRPEHGISKVSYIEAVLKGIEDYYKSVNSNGLNNINDKGIIVRLLLSIDRRENAAAAMDTAELAISLAQTHPLGSYIVGVELGGNPAVGKWEDWEPAMGTVRAAGLNVALHCAEIWNEVESLAMIDWRPGRLGHMVCMTEKVQQKLLESNIPVEICITSNVMTQSVATIADHHFIDYFSKGHPVVLCTDDPSEGIFDTTLSTEYEIAARAFGLTEEQLSELALNAVDAAFLNEEEKKALKQRMAEEIFLILKKK